MQKKKHKINFDKIIAKLDDSEKRALAKAMMPGFNHDNELHIPTCVSFANALLRGITDKKYAVRNPREKYSLAGNAQLTKAKKKNEIKIILEKDLTLKEFQKAKIEFPNMIEESKIDVLYINNYRYIGSFGSIKYYGLKNITDDIKNAK